MEISLPPHEVALRLAAATLIGVLIGVTRDLKSKPTGMRTLALVCLGAALATVATVYLDDLRSDPDALSRTVQGVLQGVLTGIAFLGAGAIIRREDDDHPGLTTAANVFVTAAIGIACGLGVWWVVFIGAGLALFVLVILHPLEKYLERMTRKRRRPSSEADDQT
ncbi:MAG: MgtC/SapB family protein [Alphaproteobacteria bacterium]|nr:MgtC/SapB family protein [Alphaproteobacteria bacterium]